MRTEYTDWVARSFRCCVRTCDDAADPHHVRGKGELGRQVDEGNVVPLCRRHHTEYHQSGKRTFARKYRVCLPAVAIDVLRRWSKRTAIVTVDMEW